MGGFEVGAQAVGLAVEPFGVLAGGLDLELEADVDISLGKGIGHTGGKAGVGALVADGDDVALARGFDVELFFEQFGQPHLDVALAVGVFAPFLLHGGRLVHLEQADHPLGDAVGRNDVDLGGHVTGDHLCRQQAAEQRVSAFGVNHQRDFGGVLLGQDQADGERGANDHGQRGEHQPEAGAEDEQKLLERHINDPGPRTGFP